ncbi:MAG: ABC transporter ATP-binding protein, partial [Acidobacteriota bacterium]
TSRVLSSTDGALLRILAGLSKPSQGSVTINGSMAREAKTRRGIGILGHSISIYDELTAHENLAMFGNLYGLSDVNGRADRMLERVGLGRVRDGLAREFSRGMRQRLAIARAFLHEPELLLLDEPFTSLDDRAIAVLQTMLQEMRDAGRTIIMSTHQIREAMELATDVVFIQRGQVVFQGPRPPEMATDSGWLYRTYGDQ